MRPSGIGLCLVLLLANGFVGAFVPTLLAADAAPSAAGAADALTVDLEYQEVDYAVVNWGIEIEPGPVGFKKEPDFGSHRVTRHALKIGADAKAAVPLAWDRTEGKLHFDLNRNSDLTDDTNGVFATSSRGYYQMFPNVRLPIEPEVGGSMVLVDLSLSESGQQVSGYMALKSFWQGRMRAGERDWQVGLVPEHRGALRPGYLVLRPWERRLESFVVTDATVSAFAWPQRLFWQNQGYVLAARFLSEGAPRRWRIEFTPHESPLGELRLSGQGLGRVLLAGSEWSVLLDEPAGSARVPVAAYSRCSVRLARDGATAYRDTQSPSTGSSLTVSAGQPAVLTAGGPLTNRVSVTRRGRLLVFSYQLVGADGAIYRIGREDRSRPPEFAVYQGEKEIATGKFEFG